MTKQSRYVVGIDVGGTFTDLLSVDGKGRLAVEKVPSRRTEIEQGVLAVLDKAEEALGMEAPLVRTLGRLVHGSTVAANAFLERKGARMAFITTKGTRDTLVMRRMYREDMYDTRSGEPPPLVTRDNVLEVDERVDHHGQIITPLNEDDVLRAIDHLRERNIEAVGICYLFSFKNPDHELLTRDLVARHLPEVSVCTSFEICPEIRDFERASTTHLNAYLQPPVEQYLRKLDKALENAGASTRLQVMHSYGGVTDAAEAAEKPVNLLLSGPAGGVIGSAYLGKIAGYPNVVSFDMGGTSCDISLIRNATPALSTPINATSTHCKFEGWDVLIPFIDIHTIGSGGGSIAWIDKGGMVHVGPESAGADPGPACYGNGGTEATVTDANVLLGYIDPDYYLGGQIDLDREEAESAVQRLADRLDISRTEAADGIFRIINTNMLNGIRVVSVEKGNDPREFALLSFGGAGACHTTALIEELEIDRVIVPPTAAAFSAFGLLCTDLRRDFVSTIYKPLAGMTASELHSAFRTMEETANTAFRESLTGRSKLGFEYSADMRYLGQGHDIRVPLPNRAGSLTPEKVVGMYNEEYERTYGYLEEEENIQVINLRVVASLATKKPVLERSGSSTKSILKRARKGERAVYFTERGKFVQTRVFDGHCLRPGNQLTGPAIVELETTTIVLRPDQRLRVDPYGNFIAARRGVKP